MGAAAGLAAVPAASAKLTATAGFGPGAGRIVIARDDGSHRHRLAGGDVSWLSPDGSSVAVMDWDPGNGGLNPRLKMYSAAGGPARFVIRRDLYPVVWSPDSTRLLATSGVVSQRLLLIDATNGSRTTLATGRFGDKSFSPDGTKVAVIRYRSATQTGGALQVIDLASGAATTIRRHAGHPVWGKRAIAFATVAVRHGEPFQNIARIRPDGTGFRPLTHARPRSGSNGFSPIDWSANGRRLLAGFFAGGVSRSYGVDAIHGGARLIARGVEPQALSRDGRRVIGQTGNPFCCSDDPVNVVRVPWRGGKRHVLLRKAFSASFND